MISRFSFRVSQPWIITLLLLSFFSCQDSEGLKPSTLADVIAQNDDFKILQTALRHAGYSDELRSENLTLFAPSDQAFIASGIASASSITALQPDSVRKLLQYYLLPGKYTVENLAVAGQKGISTAAKTKLYFKKRNEIVYANGSRIISGDIKADNGILHIIDRPFVAPSGNLMEVISSYPEYSLFTTAVNELIINDEIKQIFTADTSSYTVFVPTNAAFGTQFNLKTDQDIKLINKNFLKSIISYHIVRTRIFVTDMAPGSSLTSISKIPISVQIATDVRLLGRGNMAEFATILRKDVMATNGLVHGTNLVLIP
jgi:uncharacterized surface protein with fasciclin (FAS1) repeats